MFNNHHRARAMFDEGRRGRSIGKLQVAVATRWFAQYSSGMSVVKAEYVLKEICANYSETLEEISATKAPEVIRTIQSNAFWTELKAVMKLIEYPCNIIGKALKCFGNKAIPNWY